MDIIDLIRETKTLIFTVTPGRSGSKYLAKLLSTIPGVSSHHEPMPDFVSVMRRVQQAPEIAFSFLRHEKLPAISEIAEPIYAETSHLFCKGFLEPLLLMEIHPKLIFLRRNPTDVAWSLLERNTVPARTTYGYLYVLDPRDPNVMPLSGWENMTDYQLCFWYALEIERRQLRYIDYAKSLALPYVEVLQRDLGKPETFLHMLRGLDLTADSSIMEQHRVISNQRHNSNKRSLTRPANLEQQEADVWRAVLAYEPLLPGVLEQIYAPQNSNSKRSASDDFLEHFHERLEA
ncbi:MAG: hypothetical protein P8Y36_08085 [Alphaproteobacteria bacterium]